VAEVEQVLLEYQPQVQVHLPAEVDYSLVLVALLSSMPAAAEQVHTQEQAPAVLVDPVLAEQALLVTQIIPQLVQQTLVQVAVVADQII
jgi:hypothetical protein